MNPTFEGKASAMSSDAMKLELIQLLSKLGDKGLLHSLFRIKESNQNAQLRLHDPLVLLAAVARVHQFSRIKGPTAFHGSPGAMT